MLRFLHRQIGYRIKKRTFVVLAIALAVTFLVASLITLAAVWYTGPADILRIEIVEPESREQIIGAGLDLAALPSSNLLQDPSFEPVTFRETLTVYEGDAQTLTVSEYQIPEIIDQDGFFNGASVRVLSPGSDSLTLKKSDKVANYGINRVGSFRAVQLPADVPEGRQINDFAHNQLTSIAVGNGGLILRDLSLATPSAVISGLSSDLTGVCATADGFIACSSAGDLISSPDGATWVAWPVINPRPLRDVAALGKDLLIAVGEGGLILAGSPGSLDPVVSPVDSDLIEAAASDRVALALAADGTVLRSTTGLFWDVVQKPGPAQDRWLALDYQNGTFVLAGENGRVGFSTDGLEFTLTESQSTHPIRDILLLSQKQLIVLSQDGIFQYSNDGGKTWSDAAMDTGFASVKIALLGDRQIISADAEGRLGLAPLVIEIELQNALVSGSFESGDLFYLEKSFAEIPLIPKLKTSAISTAGETVLPSQAWEVFGPGIMERTNLSIPDEGGHSALQLSFDAQADSSESLILSQLIDPVRFVRKSRSDIYQVELWLRQEGIPDTSAQIWLSGDFESIGTTLDHIGSTWKRYTHTFVLPSNLLSSSSSVRFNVALTGGGRLWVDRIHLGRTDQPIHNLDADLTASMTGIKPTVMRFSGLSLGTSNLASEQWALASGNDAPVYTEGKFLYPEGQNLGAALALADAGKSDPWLILDSSMGEAELMHLLEYLAGPVSSPYGQMRLNQGQILPWTDLFDHVYLEIRDSDQQFSADFLRGDYVDLLIRSASQSPYYNVLKNKLIFIDGMTYSDGVWRSTADYHVSKLFGDYISAGQDGIAAAILAYYDRLPRNPSQTRQGIHELISPLDLLAEGQEQPELADLITLNLQELGTSSALSNLAWPETTITTDLNIKLRTVAASLTRQTANSLMLDTIRAESDLQVFAYRQGESTVVILANTGSQPHSARLTGLIDTKDLYLESYDAEGLLLRQRQIHRNRELLTVLPGGVVSLKNTP